MYVIGNYSDKIQNDNTEEWRRDTESCVYTCRTGYRDGRSVKSIECSTTHFWLVEPFPDGLHFSDGGVGRYFRKRTMASGLCYRWYDGRSTWTLSNNRGPRSLRRRLVRRHFGRVAQAAHGRTDGWRRRRRRTRLTSAVFARPPRRIRDDQSRHTRETTVPSRSRAHLTHCTHTRRTMWIFACYYDIALVRTTWFW